MLGTDLAAPPAPACVVVAGPGWRWPAVQVAAAGAHGERAGRPAGPQSPGGMREGEGGSRLRADSAAFSQSAGDSWRPGASRAGAPLPPPLFLACSSPQLRAEGVASLPSGSRTAVVRRCCQCLLPRQQQFYTVELHFLIVVAPELGLS